MNIGGSVNVTTLYGLPTVTVGNASAVTTVGGARIKF